MLTAIVHFAAEIAGEEPSKTPFYIAGGALALWALLISFAGIARHDGFPASAGAQRGIMGVSVLLVAAAMAAAVISS